MQRHVMRDRQHVARLEMRRQRHARRQLVGEKIKNMAIGNMTCRRLMRNFDRFGRRQLGEPRVVAHPYRAPARDDFIGMRELRFEKCRDQFARQIRRAEIDPGVLVDFAAQEAAAVGAFFTHDFGALDEAFVIDHQRAAFAAQQVLGFVKTEAAEMPDGAEIAAFVRRQQRLRGILDHQQVMALRDRHDGIHLAGQAGVMHHRNRLGARRDRGFDQFFVDIDGVGAHVDEHRHRAAQGKRVCRRYESVGRHDDFVAGRDIAQYRRHIECAGTRMGQQSALAAEALLQPFMTALGVIAVARQLSPRQRVGDVREFGADRGRLVEWNFHNLFFSYVEQPITKNRRRET